MNLQETVFALCTAEGVTGRESAAAQLSCELLRPYAADAAIDGLESFAQIPLSEIEQITIDYVSLKVLSLSQYLNVYRASIKDGYRIHVRQKKDSEKIKFIEMHLENQKKS